MARTRARACGKVLAREGAGVGEGFGEGGELLAGEDGDDELAARGLGEARVGVGEVLGLEGDDDGVGRGAEVDDIFGEADTGAGGKGGAGGVVAPEAGEVGDRGDLLGDDAGDDGRGHIAGSEERETWHDGKEG